MLIYFSYTYNLNHIKIYCNGVNGIFKFFKNVLTLVFINLINQHSNNFI